MKKINYTELQFAVLSVLTTIPDEEVSLIDLENKIYRLSHKKRPKNSRQSTAACIRNLEKKLRILKARIVRRSPLGRGNEARYIIKGRVDLVRKSLEAFE